MKVVVTVLVVVALQLATVCAGRAHADSPAISTEDALGAIEARRSAAIRALDFPALEGIYGPGFVAIGANGSFVDRAQLFDRFRNADPSLRFVTDDVRVLDHGDAAIYTARLTTLSADGNVVARVRIAHHYLRRSGQWRFVFGQASPIPAADGTPR